MSSAESVTLKDLISDPATAVPQIGDNGPQGVCTVGSREQVQALLQWCAVVGVDGATTIAVVKSTKAPTPMTRIRLTPPGLQDRDVLLDSDGTVHAGR